jgi:cbb3-type cytochrome oxidase subunit 3
VLTRKLIAYGLMALLLISITSWAWLRQRRERREIQRRHGPRLD